MESWFARSFAARYDNEKQGKSVIQILKKQMMCLKTEESLSNCYTSW